MRKLLFRLSVSHLLVALGSLALLLWLSPQLFLHYYLAAEEQRLSAAVEGLARVAEQLSAEPGGGGSLGLLVRNSGAMLGGDVALVARGGASVLEASRVAPEGAHWALTAWRDYRRSGRTGTHVARVPGNMILLVRPAQTATGPVGAVVVRRRAPELQTLLRAHRLMTAASAGISLLLALVLSLVVSRAIAAPLVTMSQAAQRLAAEDFSATVPERGPLELASLGSSLNRMAAALAAAFAALSAERRRLEEVLATMAEGVVGLDAEGRVTLANQSARDLLAHPLQAGLPLAEALGTDQTARVADAMAERAVLGATVSHGERFLGLSLSPAADGGAVLVLADVTATQHLETMRRDFVASVSHELRAPLTSIRGFLGALLDGTAEAPEERDHCLRVADQEAARMARLVEELLELSRLQAGVMEFERQPTRLDEVIAAVAASFAPRLEEKQVRLIQDLAPDLPGIEADGDRLAQVLVNLLDNALRFSPAGGTVTVRSGREADGAVTCSVADEGPGIAPEDLERVFERFYKADRARRRTDRGAGLGLAIVREIVRTHGGEAFASNRPEGGAEIGFRLPRR